MEERRSVVFYGVHARPSLGGNKSPLPSLGGNKYPLTPSPKGKDLESRSEDQEYTSLVEELRFVLQEMKEELQDIRNLKAALVDSPPATPSPDMSLLAHVTLFEKMEKQRNDLLNRTKEREARWLIEEEKMQKERLEYEEEERKFIEIGESKNVLPYQCSAPVKIFLEKPEKVSIPCASQFPVSKEVLLL